MQIFYLHGFASGPGSKKAAFFRDRIPQLQVPDLAAGDFEHLTITGQLRVIEEVAGGEKVSLIGSSLGGYLAALYGARHPEVGKLVLLAPAFGFAARWAKNQRWTSDGFLEVYHYGEQRTRLLSHGLVDDARGYEDFPGFSQPGLIFHGIHDDAVPAQLSQDFAASHANVRLRLLDSDHELLDVLDIIWQEAAAFLLG